MSAAAIVAALALHAFALFGFGRFVLRRAGMLNLGIAMSVAIGLAVVVILGGVLNLARAAAAPSPQIVLAVGTALGIFAVPFRTLRERQFQLRAEAAVCVLLVTLAFVLCATILPTPTFNYYDDLQKYFAHPVRMLQTGTVFGSSLSAMGFETLGGQAYLHGFVLALADLDMLHAADTVFAFLMLLALLGTAEATRPTVRWIAMGAAALINPQIVNISATYTAAVLAAALVLLLGRNTSLRASAVLGGIILAALCALKSSLGLFALTLGLTLGAAQLSHARWFDGARWCGLCAGTALICLAPWVLVHLPHLLLVSKHRSPPPAPSLAAPYSVEPFSWQSAGYGPGFAPYTYAVLVLVVLAVIAFIRTRPRSFAVHAVLWLSFGMALLYAGMLYLVGPVSQGEHTMLRLFAPMLIGVLPASYLLIAQAPSRRTRRELILASVLGIAPLVPFLPFAAERAQRALVHGSVFVVARLDQAPWYRALNHYMLHGGMHQQVRTAQAAIPVGAPFVAWIGAPYWLDYLRNPVTDLDMAGLETPWARIPDTHFVLWEFAGRTTGQLAGFDEVRHSSGAMAARIGEAGLRFTRALLSLEPRPKLRWNDGQFLVFELADATQLRECYLSTRTDTTLGAPGMRSASRRFGRARPDHPLF